VGEFGQFVVGAGDNDHGVRLKGTTGDTGADVFVGEKRNFVMVSAYQSGEVDISAGFQAKFFMQKAAAKLRDDEENVDVGGDEGFQEPSGVKSAGSAGDGDDDTLGHGSSDS
jgi:hypothetical protein